MVEGFSSCLRIRRPTEPKHSSLPLTISSIYRVDCSAQTLNGADCICISLQLIPGPFSPDWRHRRSIHSLSSGPPHTVANAAALTSLSLLHTYITLQPHRQNPAARSYILSHLRETVWRIAVTSCSSPPLVLLAVAPLVEPLHDHQPPTHERYHP